ncbi:MAG: YfhO family protein [Candidatus Omnitrophica bacterium]|nr:YfhO family protein [Candidatus Omnitrophota bacterium]
MKLSKNPIIVLVLWGITAWCYRMLFTHPHVVISDDMIYDVIPIIKFFADSFRQGFIPLWNPYCQSGVPAFTQPIMGPFYPTFFLFYLIPHAWFLSVQLLIHLALCVVFLYYFGLELGMRRIPAAASVMTFVLSSIFLRIIAGGYLTYAVGLCWMPALFLFSERLIKTERFIWVWLLGIVSAFVLLSAHSVGFYVSFFFVSCYFFIRIAFLKIPLRKKSRFLLFFLFALAIGFGFAAAYFFPYVSNILGSGLKLRGILGYLYPRDLFLYLFPFSYKLDKLKTILTVNYFGICAIAVIALAWNIKKHKRVVAENCFWVLAFFFLLLSMGQYGVVYSITKLLSPFFSVINHVELWEMPFVFSCSILLGFAINHLIVAANSRANYSLVRASFKALAFLLMVVVLAHCILVTVGKNTHAYFSLNASDYSRLIFFFLLPIAVVLVTRKRFLPYLAVLLFACILFDMVSYQSASFRLSEIRSNLRRNDGTFDYYDENDVSRFIKSHPGYYRIFRDRWPRYQENRMISLGIFEVKGIYDVPVKRYKEYVMFMNQARGSHESFCRQAFNSPDSPLSDLLNIRYAFYSEGASPDVTKFTYQEDLQGGIKVYENKNFIPRAFLVREVEAVDSSNDALKRLADPQFKPLETAVIERSDSFFHGLKKEFASRDDYSRGGHNVSIAAYSANTISLVVDTSTDALLVLSEIFVPGWNAYVDGEKIRISRVNYLLRGIPLQAGRHSILVKYEPISFGIGVVVSAITLCGLLIVIFLNFRKERYEKT